MMKRIWPAVQAFLGSPMWAGVVALLALFGAMYGVTAWVLQITSRQAAIEQRLEELQRDQAAGPEEAEGRERPGEEAPMQESNATVEPPAGTEGVPLDPGNAPPAPPPALTEFAVSQRVRCPGGGDIFGRERNRRRGWVVYPPDGWTEGPVVIEEVHIQVLEDNFGSYSPIEYMNHNSEGEATRVRSRIQCNPPNYPGAAGGWMQVRLHGTYRRP